jgi:para-nitrobenzyl esterase
MKKRSLTLALAAAAVAAITGCGGDGGISSTAFTGALVDDGVQGVTYFCGGKTGVTEENGYFDCTTAPVSFSLGTITLGTIDAITSDYLVFPQDIVGVDRNDTIDGSKQPEHTIVTNMAILLQSLDIDGNLTNGINITQDTVDLLNGLPPHNIADYSVSEMEDLVTQVVADAKSAGFGSLMDVVDAATALANLALTVETPPDSPTQPGATTGSSGGI